MIIVRRSESGVWWAHKRVYIGEHAEILDLLFGKGQDDDTE